MRRRDARPWGAVVQAGDGTLRPLRDFPAPYRPDGLVEWGSVTKAVTAAAVGAAVAEGLVQLDDDVSRVVPRLTAARFSVGEVLEHRAGLLRMAHPLRATVQRDPYADVVGRRLDPDVVAPVLRRGEVLYSNLGYAVLGEVLDTVTGDWWAWSTSRVLDPAGVSTATLRPLPSERVLPRRRDGTVAAPWTIGAGAYAAAGGVWSTFADLTRFLAASVREPTTPRGWQRGRGADLVNGATRHSRACALRPHGSTDVVVAHGLRTGAALDRWTIELTRALVDPSDRERGG